MTRSRENTVHEAEVTQQEIDAALDLSAQSDFGTSLAFFQAMLNRTRDENLRYKILYGIVTCSTWLNLDEIRNNAIEELKHLPDYEISHAFVVMTLATAFVDSRRPEEALGLIDENLQSDILQRDDFQDWRYEHLFLKGRCFVQLARCDEALCALATAHDMDPEGKCETDILIDRANCFLALSRYDEAYESASQVLSRGDQDMATLAMQYMAECRMWQSRVPEALEWYAAVQKRLPCRLVQEERIQQGITNAIAYLEKLHPQGKPS